MGFKQFVNEANYTEYTNFDEMVAMIKKDCKPFLKHKTQIWRGMPQLSNLPNMGKRDVRKHRKPLDSSKTEDILINTFLKKHNLPLRSESMFATSRLKNTQIYGKPYLVFPIGNFRFVYFTEVPDFSQDVFHVFKPYNLNKTNLKDFHTVSLDKEWDEDKRDKYFVKDIFDILALHMQAGLSLKDAVDKYIAELKEDFKGLSKWDNGYASEFKKIEDALSLFLKKFKYKTDNMAASKGYELIIDCKEYYFIEENVVNNITITLQNKLGIKSFF
jgi:hypothetical protein